MASSQRMLFESILLMACTLVVAALVFRERAVSRPASHHPSLRVRFPYTSREDDVSSDDAGSDPDEPLLSASLFALHASHLHAQGPSSGTRSEPVGQVPQTQHLPLTIPTPSELPDALGDTTQHLPLTLTSAPSPTPQPPAQPAPPQDPGPQPSPSPAPLPGSDQDPTPAPVPAPQSTALAPEVLEVPVASEPSAGPPQLDLDSPALSPAPPPLPEPAPAVSFEAAAPWTAPADTRFPYQGLEHDLDALLKVQASADNWISIITMSGKVKRFVLNCVFTLHKYGAWPHFILVAFDPDSLEVCKQLNLPCFSGEAFTSREVSDGDHSYGTGNATEIWWGKQRLATELLRRGYNVHGSDADVVYFRRLHDSYRGVFEKTDADAVFATEEWIRHHYNLVNAGVYAVRSNARSVRFFEVWTADTELGRGGVDQDKLNRMFMHGFLTCDSMTSCRAVQNLGKFAIFRHKSFFPSNYCVEDSLRPTPCDLRRMYLHQLCIHGWPSKGERWDQLNLWFIDEDLKPMFADGGGTRGPHAFMPCVEQVAWTDIEQGTIA